MSSFDMNTLPQTFLPLVGLHCIIDDTLSQAMPNLRQTLLQFIDILLLLLLLLLRMNVIATLQSIDFKVAATAKSCGKMKVSHAAVKSFDRRGVSCKNARTVQFSELDQCHQCANVSVHTSMPKEDFFAFNVSQKYTNNKFIRLILSTIRQNGDIVLDTSEFCNL